MLMRDLPAEQLEQSEPRLTEASALAAGLKGCQEFINSRS